MAFGSTYPNYDVSALSEQVCARQGWKLAKVRLHTGIPDVGDHARWHFFWTHKLVAMGRRGVVVYSRPLRNRNRKVVLPDGTNLRFARLAQVARTLGPEGGAHRSPVSALPMRRSRPRSEVSVVIVGP